MGVYITSSEVTLQRWKRRLREVQNELAAARVNDDGLEVISTLECDVLVALNHVDNWQRLVEDERRTGPAKRNANADMVLAL